jgi:hypothetical protein
MPMKDIDAPIDAVVELSVVTDDSLQECILDWQSKGYRLQSIDYVVTDASKRPQMAFLFFTQTVSSQTDIQ